jgi:endoglucanase
MPNYTTDAGKFLKDGVEFKINGIAWSGGEGTALFPYCWNNSYQAMIQKAKSIGINAFRLPVTKETFIPTELTNQGGQINTSFPDNAQVAGIPSLQAFDILCNYLASNQMYFIFDFHTMRKGTVPGQAEFGAWYGQNGLTETDWISYMVTLANRYKNNAYFLGLDLDNEPWRAKWDGSNDQRNWRRAAEICGQAVLNANSNILVMIEGVQENEAGISTGVAGGQAVPTNWGADLRAAGTYPIRPEFVPKNKLVYCPHPYGPDVIPPGGFDSYFFAGNFPNSMEPVWQGQFGYLMDQGYTVIAGEYGGWRIDKGEVTDRTQRDLVFQKKLVDWFASKGSYNHFGWMMGNEGSDTAGLLQDDMSSFNPNPKAHFEYRTALNASSGNSNNGGGNTGGNSGGNTFTITGLSGKVSGSVSPDIGNNYKLNFYVR